MRIKRHILATLALLTTVAGMWSQGGASVKAPVSIMAKVDTATVTMGDRAMVHVEVVRNRQPGVYIDGLRRDNGDIMMLGNVEVRQVSSDSSQIGEDRYQVNYHYQIQPFEVGAVTVGPFKYVIDGDTLESRMISFKVEEPDIPKVMRDSLFINPMESTVSIKSQWYDFIPEWWPWVLIGIAVVALGVLLFYLFKKNGPGLLPRKRVEPPYQLAIRRLTKIKQRRLAESGNDKEYYTELTDVLRQYIEGRFGINAREMTSSQILEAVNANEELKGYVPSMSEMMMTSDAVKFAKHQSNVDDNNRSYTVVHDFVEQTKPVETPPGQSAPRGTKKSRTTRRQVKPNKIQ